ncbi:ATP synthase F1 subunit epsilon [Ileibacterium valens]|uniref:ATP synthase F1 subunit epsilon n=1 Tax=Ileibacterium valens TaxID=1862668 RepID=UPI002354AC1B|nr:ATP synthase F1 subunit epsilon [Ileibacterium valens]
MAGLIDLKMVTPHGVFRQYKVQSIHAKSVEGEFTILPNHVPVVMALVPCKLEIYNEEGKHKSYAVAGGFLHFDNNKCLLLSDAIEGRSDIDIKRAHDAYERARSRMEKKDTNSEMRREELALQKAINRINVYGKK